MKDRRQLDILLLIIHSLAIDRKGFLELLIDLVHLINLTDDYNNQ